MAMDIDQSGNSSTNEKNGWYLVGLSQCVLFAYLMTMLVVHTQKMTILERDYPMWLNAKEVASSVSSNRLDLLVIGDSRAKAGFIPNLAHKKTLNLSLTGQSPIEGYYLLLNYLKNNPPPEKLLVSYAPYHLCVVDVFWEMAVKYGFLSFADYTEVWETSRHLEDKALGDKNLRWQYFFLPSKYWASVRMAVKERRWNINDETYKAVVSSNGHYYYGRSSGSKDLNEEAELDKFSESRLLDLYLGMTIDLARSRNVEVFWYTMPFNQESCDNLPESFTRDFAAYLSALESRKDIKVIQRIACLPNALFGDRSHLYLGANATTLAILENVFDVTVPTARKLT